MSCLKPSRRTGFTLIEMLVVIAIIGILAALLIPAMNRSRNTARRAKAVNDIKQIETAFRGYYDEYHKWPVGLLGYDDAGAEARSTGIQMRREVVQMLAGASDPLSKTVNPRQIPFLEVSTSALNANGEFIDPWDKGSTTDPNLYKYMLDFDSNNTVHVEFNNNSWSTNLLLNVAVWSRGPDHKDELGYTDDNVYNF